MHLQTAEVFMNLFFKHISEMNKTLHNVSLMVISGPNCGEKALWSDAGYIYTSKDLPLWECLASSLSEVNGPILKDCDGNTIFCEALSSPPNMIICGCGHVSLPIITIGKLLGFHVTAIDDRPQFCDNARRACADRVICDNFADGLKQVPEDKNNYFIIVTRGHRYDIECLETLIHRAHTYIGMMGSKVRIKAVKETLISKGIDEALLDTVHMPIGLKIKAETPEEIAVSITSEIIQVKNEAYATYSYSKEMLKALLEPSDQGGCALVTILRRRGSAPRSTGTKMLVLESGRIVGTIGGGCAEAAVFQKALRCIRENKTEIVHVDMTGREAEEEGMVCGGVIDVFIEPIFR